VVTCGFDVSLHGFSSIELHSVVVKTDTELVVTSVGKWGRGGVTLKIIVNKFCQISTISNIVDKFE